MKKFKDLLSDFIKTYQNMEAEGHISYRKDPLYIISQNWEQLSKYVKDPILLQSLQESQVKDLVDNTLLIFTKNANAKFVINMNQSQVLKSISQLISEHLSQECKDITKIIVQ